ncbi:DUF2589 domain-containing protein [Tenacibaculum todarodis]|uniref:DUF2589 domain-containing protein n=1 Tax=Tenacibaculum todarodis TaxID=1850252 RepID=UPI0009F3A896|nr:DUF2589 domain-containing protein [Tenacibaculum todarodis]
MKKLQTILKQDHSKKTKKELIELLTGINEIVGDDFGKITGIQLSELSKTKNDDLVAIINSFKENYDVKWEESFGEASTKILKTILAQIEKDENQFSTSNASDADFAAELGSIDFENLIGGPLNACVTAQANASMSTVNFIKEVGFEDDGTLRMVDFSYTKTVPNDDGTGTTTEDISLIVPFVSVLNIPSLRIETCEVDFNVKLNSVYTKDVSSEFGIDADVSGGWGPVKFKVSASYKRSSSTGVKVEKEYTMGVKVVATNDQMPGGLEKVLGILSE